MSAPNNLTAAVHLCEDTDKTFDLLDLLAMANYSPEGPVHIDRIQVRNPDGTLTNAPTSLVQVSADGKGMVITASKEANWNGYFETLDLVVESGTEYFSIKVGVTVDAVNDAPEGTDATISVVDGSGYVFKEADFGFRDPLEGDAFKSVRISSLPAAGQLLLGTTVLAAGAEVSVADIRAGRLVYLPPADGSVPLSLGFQVRDDGGTEGCNAADLDGTPNHITIQVPAALGSLGDRVWYDTDRDGVQDAGEAGVAGVSVRLKGAGADGTFGTADDINRTTTTDGQGLYGFTGLAAGQYQVTFGGKTGYGFTTANVGDDASDSDADANGVSQLINLGAGERNTTIDAGLVAKESNTARLGDRVWHDTDGNGVQGASETGVAGVTVKLAGAGADGILGNSDDIARTTTTNSAGNYLFDGLAAGNYQVTFGGVPGYQFTSPNVGDDALDSDANANGISQVVALAIGESNLTVDAGLVTTLPVDTGTAQLGDRVWFDDDHDGVQDAGETGVAGLTVTLAGAGADGSFGTADDVSRSTTTNAAGNYLFTGLAAGNYQVTFGGKPDLGFTTANVGDDAADSDADVTTGKSQVVALAIGESNLTVDAGMVKADTGTAQLGDRVWYDTDRDGVQDAGETGVAGLTVTLAGAGADGILGNGDDISRTTTTNSAGNYLFTGLAAGQYQVGFGDKAGYGFTTANVGDDATDSDANVATGKSQVVALAIGESNLTVDAGLVKTDTGTAQLGDRVWYDTNRNGVQDAGETGVAGITVTLLSAGADGVLGNGDDVTRNTTTNSAGNYLFTGLDAGQYQVGFGGKTGYTFTTSNVGNDATDSDASVSNGRTPVIGLAIGESNLTVDAGLVSTAPVDSCTAQLGDRVWYDTDRDGVQDANEAGVAGVSVTLAGAGADGSFGTADDVSRTTTTNSAGNYLFTGLAAGQYQVTFGGKAGYTFTAANVGNDAFDSDANVVTGKSQVVALGIGESNLTVDAGLIAPVNVCAKIVSTGGATGSVSMNEGSNLGFRVQLDQAVTQTTQFWVQINDGSAHRTTFDASSQIVFADYRMRTTDYSMLSDTFNGTWYAMRGPASQTWDYGVKDTSGSLVGNTSGFYVTVAAGSTTSAAFSVSAWREFVAVDRDGNKALGVAEWYKSEINSGAYKEAANENFSLTLQKSSGGEGVVVCNPNTTVNICDTSYYDIYSPIVLDLDGNGVHTTALGATAGTFDLLGQGEAVASGWASAGDGFLAVDANGNGVIDGIGELFGGKVGEGFAKLGAYDSNGDGVVDARDADFGKLLVWQDANSNHVTDAGELRTLGEAGIVALNTHNVFQNVEQNGNILGETSTAVRADGSSIEMIDVYFQYDASALPELGSLVEADNTPIDTALGGGSTREQPAIADITFDAASEAQRVIAEAMKQADASLAVIA